MLGQNEAVLGWAKSGEWPSAEVLLELPKTAISTLVEDTAGGELLLLDSNVGLVVI